MMRAAIDAAVDRARRVLLTDPITGETLDLLSRVVLACNIVGAAAMVLAIIGLALALGPGR